MMRKTSQELRSLGGQPCPSADVEKKDVKKMFGYLFGIWHDNARHNAALDRVYG
jgi:hypothetical protein